MADVEFPKNFISVYGEGCKEITDIQRLSTNIICISETVSIIEGEDPVHLQVCYDNEGKYIGGGLDLLERMPFMSKIDKFEKRTPTSTICSIGLEYLVST